VPIINLEALVETLVALPAETEWVEFKHNRFDPQEVGEYVSALANGAILTDQRSAYLVFGIEDGSHQVVGTTADPMKHKVGGEAFINWLARGLDPRLNIEVGEGRCRDQRVVVLVIDPAYARPVRFMGVEYIRNGPHKRRLADFPEKERALWLATTRFSFEQADAARHIAPSDVVSSLHLDVFFNLLQEPKPGSESAIIDRLIREGLIRDDLQGGYDISNLAALTLAKDLSAFPGLRRKVLRIVRYRGTDKLETLEERTPTEGYAASFQAILRSVLAAVPAHEAIIDGVRRNVPMVPEIALREVIANALIHQDLTTGGAGPLIEIYADRVEVTNPGEPLVEPDRFLDAPPRSRNEALASLMRRLRICEERGSGVDKIVASVETRALPAPTFRAAEGMTIVTLFAERPFSRMSSEDRVRACYQHACLKFAAADPMSNASLRQRLGLRDEQYPQASLVIRAALDVGRIKPADTEQGRRNARYLPFWA
jgi:predicted HTH transcriptional regulator